MSYQAIEVKPVSGALGAEIFGVDVSGDLGNRVVDELHRAFLDHHILCFRDQALTPQQQVAFAGRFGKLDIYPFLESLPDAPEVIEILKTENDSYNFGGAWHSDTAYLERPALGTMLYAIEVPPTGGDTMFANMHLAYEALSDGMKRMLDGLVGINSSDQNYRGAGGRNEKMKDLKGMKDKVIERTKVYVAEQPVVRTHPETGQKGLYVSRVHTARFRDMTEAESKPLLDYLCDHAVRPEFTCRIDWRPGTLVLWDNRSTQHYAVNDYHGFRRRMHRVTLMGDRPS